MVFRLGLADRVKFLPPITYVGDALAGADCLIHLSFIEADSLVIKEAFLAGLPVVHTSVGAIPEMEAEFGPVGWSVRLRPTGPETNPNEFDQPAALPAHFLVDPDEAADQVRQALLADHARPVVDKMRKIAWERWTGPTMCERWANYLEDIVGRWSGPVNEQEPI
jgi:glycosyltransferase involved in cell wall biosynthesis